jgi:hypothetical protein
MMSAWEWADGGVREARGRRRGKQAFKSSCYLVRDSSRDRRLVCWLQYVKHAVKIMHEWHEGCSR